MISDALFFVFAGLTLICGLLTVANPFSRNPITSAIFLVLTILSLAGLFVLLHAFFLAAIQVLIYAGAVMVLFLFVIMLLDLPEEERRKFKSFISLVAFGGVALIVGLMIRIFVKVPLPALVMRPPVDGGAAPLGRLLFSDFLLPFEMMSVVLLVAMVGVILLSKREIK